MNRGGRFLRLLKRAKLDHYEALGQESAEVLLRRLIEINREYQVIETLPSKRYIRRLIETAALRSGGKVLSADLPGDEDFPRPRPKKKQQQRPKAKKHRT